MNFELTDEQQMLQDSVARFVTDEYSIEARHKNVALEQGFNPDNWQKFADLGWLSIPFNEDLGGIGGGAVDLMVVMEELGKGLVAEPYLPTVVLFGGLLAKSGNSVFQEQLIPKIIDGSLQGAFAFHERQSRFELSDVLTTANAEADGFILNGEKTVVFNGAVADKLVVVARTSGQQSDEDGLTLFVVDANAQGISKISYRLMDGQLVANIRFDNVSVGASDVLGDIGQGYSLMMSVVDDALVSLAAEAQGNMQFLLNATVEYSKTREQFGVAIGSFQALQHRMVDMFAACESSRSLLYRAVCSIDEDEGNYDAADVKRNLTALKVTVGRSGELIGGESIQLHGGMGMTEEMAVGNYVKRLMTIDTTFGDADYHQFKFIGAANNAEA